MNMIARITRNKSSQSGFGMIEVLIAVLVLAIGFVILAGLQVRLIEGEADAKARTIATRLAADQVEQMRGFMDISEYIAYDSQPAAVFGKIGGVEFRRQTTVTRHRYNPDPNNDGDRSDAAFITLPASNNTTDLEQQPEYKQVTVTVSWTSPTGRARQVAVQDLISSAAPRDGMGTLRPDTGSRTKPIMRIYAPNDVGVIPIAVGTDADGNEVASAASNPKPTHYAEGTTGTTKFTVQNYISDQDNPLLQRQLDFAYASCTCRLAGTTTTQANPSYTPTYWDGLRYVTPKPLTARAYGIVDTRVDQDSQLCEACCRDHHDATSQALKVDPFRFPDSAGVANYSASGNHLHFNAKAGFSTPVAAAGDVYSESCRMVRVEGIYRVATDTRLEDISVLRLHETASGPAMDMGLVDSYASFAKSFVESAYAGKSGSYPAGGLPVDKAVVGAPYELDPSSTYIPRFLDENRDHVLSKTKGSTQYFAARGIYIDWISPQAQEKINCIGSSADACSGYRNLQLLELVPFVAVNLTDLADWSSTQPTLVSIRNDAIPLVKKGGGARTPFVRGLATMISDGQANIRASISRSNSGVVGTLAIDPQDKAEALFDQEEIKVGTTSPPSDKGSFITNILDNTADANFARQNLKVEMTFPVNLSTPVCTKGAVNSDPYKHLCVYEKDTQDVRLRFSNYNYPVCSHLGKKWSYDPDLGQCVLPPQNKNDTAQYAAPQMRNFSVCSLSTPTGSLKIVGRTVYNAGTIGEYTEIDVQRNGATSIWNALSGMTDPTFNADFRKTCP